MGGVGHHPDDVPCVPITRLRLGQKKCLKTVLQIWRVVPCHRWEGGKVVVGLFDTRSASSYCAAAMKDFL